MKINMDFNKKNTAPTQSELNYTLLESEFFFLYGSLYNGIIFNAQ